MEKGKLSREELERELEIAKNELEIARKNDNHSKRGAIKYRLRYGSYPADNFDGIDSHTTVKTEEKYVKYLESQLKQL